jgi:hypothetical protein
MPPDGPARTRPATWQAAFTRDDDDVGRRKFFQDGLSDSVVAPAAEETGKQETGASRLNNTIKKSDRGKQHIDRRPEARRTNNEANKRAKFSTHTHGNRSTSTTFSSENRSNR